MVDLIDMTLARLGHSAGQAARLGMNIVGLVPLMVDTGVGSDVAKRIAAPLRGGLVSLIILTLAVIPAFYVIWRGWHLCRDFASGTPVTPKPVSERGP